MCKIGFSVHNINLDLFGQVENTKCILCSRKIGVKSVYLRFKIKNCFGFSKSESANERKQNLNHLTFKLCM